VVVRGDALRNAGKSSTLGFGKVSSVSILNEENRLLSLRLTFASALGELKFALLLKFALPLKFDDDDEEEENIFDRGDTVRLFGQFATMCPGSLQ
jgi:hypothetical protein